MISKRKFSSFKKPADAYKELQIKDIVDWVIPFQPLAPSDFFREHLRRLQGFNLTNSEDAKKMLIDAAFEEILTRHERLRVWKSEPLESDTLVGVVDYLVAPRICYVETPLLCVTEAKKDNFEQGLSQCLVEMKACRWNHEQAGKSLTVFGIVSNAASWNFYKLTTEGQVFGSEAYSWREIENLLGVLDYIWAECESNL